MSSVQSSATAACDSMTRATYRPDNLSLLPRGTGSSQLTISLRRDSYTVTDCECPSVSQLVAFWLKAMTAFELVGHYTHTRVTPHHTTRQQSAHEQRERETPYTHIYTPSTGTVCGL